MDETLSQDEEALAMERIVRNQVRIAELEAENAMLKQFFKDRPEAYPKGTNLKRGRFYVKVTGNTRIDQKLAEKVLGPTQFRNVSKLTVDAAKARAFLSEDDLAKITKVYDNKLEFGLAD